MKKEEGKERKKGWKKILKKKIKCTGTIAL